VAQKWEYDVVTWTASSDWDGESGEDGMKAMLATKGGEGWELVALTESGSSYTFFFKHPALVWVH